MVRLAVRWSCCEREFCLGCFFISLGYFVALRSGALGLTLASVPLAFGLAMLESSIGKVSSAAFPRAVYARHSAGFPNQARVQGVAGRGHAARPLTPEAMIVQYLPRGSSLSELDLNPCLVAAHALIFPPDLPRGRFGYFIH